MPDDAVLHRVKYRVTRYRGFENGFAETRTEEFAGDASETEADLRARFDTWIKNDLLYRNETRPWSYEIVAVDLGVPFDQMTWEIPDTNPEAPNSLTKARRALFDLRLSRAQPK